MRRLNHPAQWARNHARRLSVTLAALLCAGLHSVTVAQVPPPNDLATARSIFSELVGINSTHAYGSTRIAEAIAARLRTAGFSSADVQVLTPPDHPTKGNVLVRLKGLNRGQPILYIGHLDVVEALREDWSVDPFTLTEKDGFYYGRGTSDMKGDAAAALSGLIRLHDAQTVLDRDLVLALTADEEVGGDANGIEWLLTEHRELIDAAYVVNLDSGQPAMRNGQRLYASLQTSEKGYLSFLLEVTDKGGHSSLPTPENPIYRLATAVARLPNLEFPVRLTDTTRAFFLSMAQFQSGQHKADMLAVAHGRADSRAIRRLSTNPFLNAQLRTTCVATLFNAGHAENALPERARAIAQCRLIPGDAVQDVHAALVDILADPSISVTVSAPAKPNPPSPLASDVLEALRHVTSSMWPGVPVVPIMETGGTDGAKTRAAGMRTYGISGIFRDIDDDREHGRDERISVESFAEGVEFTFHLMRAVAGAH